MPLLQKGVTFFMGSSAGWGWGWGWGGKDTNRGKDCPTSQRHCTVKAKDMPTHLSVLAKKEPAYTSLSLRVRLADWVPEEKSGFCTKDLFSWQIKSQLLY